MTPPTPLWHTTQPVPDNFKVLAHETLEYLNTVLSFDTWVIAPAHDQDWIVVGEPVMTPDRRDAAHHTSLQSLCTLASTNTSAHIVDNTHHARHPLPLSQPLDERIGAYLHLPLIAPNQTQLGALCAFAPTAITQPTDAHLRLLTQTARTLSSTWHFEQQWLAVTHKAARLRAESETDVLTGLPNRRAWNRHLTHEEARCRRYGDQAAVIMVDLDGLKAINDQQGHHAGDRVINHAAIAIAQAIRNGDICARVGGDEFAVLLTRADEDTANRVKRRIAANLKRQRIEASIGYARHDRQETLQSTIEAADGAMYQTKRQRYRRMPTRHSPTN